MRIKVKIHGHQHYSEVIGEVAYWCSAVEQYSRSPPLQVPAVLINTGEKIELVPLQREYYRSEIEVLPDSADSSK